MKYYLGYGQEGFGSAVINTVIPAKTIQDCIYYAAHDYHIGFIDSFQVYDQTGEMVFEQHRSTAA